MAINRQCGERIRFNAEITPRDFMEAPSLADRGGILRARQVPGTGLNEMLENMQKTVVAQIR